MEVCRLYWCNHGVKTPKYSSAKVLAVKYVKGKNLEDEKTKEKLFRHLVSRGYSYGIVKKVLKEFGTEIDE